MFGKIGETLSQGWHEERRRTPANVDWQEARETKYDSKPLEIWKKMCHIKERNMVQNKVHFGK